MFHVDKYSRKPIYEQFIEQIEYLILQGVFRPDELVPSVRFLSQELSVNPNTLQKAYSELERKGICYTVPGNGRFVSPDAAQIIRQERSKLMEDIARLTKELYIINIPLDDILSCVSDAYNQAANQSIEEDQS